MDTKLLEFALVLALLFSLFTTASGDRVRSHGSIVYNRGQLLALRQTAVLPDERPDISRELRRKRRGCRAGALRRTKRRRYRPVLPSVIMGNVRSLPNKMDELAALTRHQREYRECSVMLFSESWLTALTPDTVVTLDGFQLIRADRTTESGKRKGGKKAIETEEEESRDEIAVLSTESSTIDDSDDEEMKPPSKGKKARSTKQDDLGRTRAKTVGGAIIRYKRAVHAFNQGGSMKKAFQKVGVDRNTISRTSPIPELAIAAPGVFQAL
ncbi:uncharacterized protein LOC108410896 [Pygocentrus nattereri]|uniref:uncharacterized protein LOC108410896 n=1 Tax=Pygocentrus nattereri TaxID=42514 RepID=UPI00081457A0|nr:uncharacterized protein LOC108410896 [Pygocentrus nattereri]